MARATVASLRPPINLDIQFQNFAKYTIKTAKDIIEIKKEEHKKDGTTITLRQIDFWFEQAKLLDRYLTRTDTGMAYILFQAGCIGYPEFLLFLDNLAQSKKRDLDDMKFKLMTCGLPGVEPKKPKDDKDKNKDKDKDKEKDNNKKES